MSVALVFQPGLFVAAISKEGPGLRAGTSVKWSQTVFRESGKYDLLKEMPPLTLKTMVPKEKALTIERSNKYQTLLGFGGAFTEATALNWRSLTKEDQDEVIRLYFASAEEGGLAYTVGRVPMNSCDFGPGGPLRYYNFDDHAGDVTLEHFDDTVSHDVESGMIPMIQAAQAAINRAGGELSLFASPWSPPGWMKLPTQGPNGETLERSMLRTAVPNGLDPEMQRPYANYFSRFISAYKKHGIPMWGVTVQNEAEAADVGWEKCVYTPDFQAAFVRDHLGPVLRAEHPGTKIIGFDHNKDHVGLWAKGLYKDPAAREYFDGIGVHWYGGLNTHNLDFAHDQAPEKFLLATEACNCPGVIYKSQPLEWWQRAEHLGMDILQDLLHWCTGWVDWNLLVDITGGPNHLGNRCDANLIADPDQKKGLGSIVLQASYYYMGHFSRYLPAGSRRIEMTSTVVKEREITVDDVVAGQPLVFLPCSGSDVQSWTLDDTASLYIANAPEMCVDISNHGSDPRLDAYTCAHTANQMWERRIVPACSDEDAESHGIACSQLVNPPTGKCLTKSTVSGALIGLDAGTMYTVAQAQPCKSAGEPSQTFELVRGDQGGFPGDFPIRAPAIASNDPDSPDSQELCMQPFVRIEPNFGAVAFETPDGGVSVVALNSGDAPLTFDLYDSTVGMGVEDVTMPAHSMQSFVLPKAVDTPAPALTAKAPTMQTPPLPMDRLDANAAVRTGAVLMADQPATSGAPTESAAPPSFVGLAGALLAVAIGALALVARRRLAPRTEELWPRAEAARVPAEEDTEEGGEYTAM